MRLVCLEVRSEDKTMAVGLGGHPADVSSASLLVEQQGGPYDLHWLRAWRRLVAMDDNSSPESFNFGFEKLASDIWFIGIK